MLAAEPQIVAWALASVEALSGLHRQHREGLLSDPAATQAIDRLCQLRECWTEVGDLALVSGRAERLLAVHPLRAGDALQLAAALVVCEERPVGQRSVCLDANLASAARREGFTTPF